MEIIKISDIKPAEYNPRKISEDAFKELQGSLKTLGFILPIIINKDTNTIVAGHQRTKAATAVGITEVPARFVSNVNIAAEVMFNQVHNGVETEPDEQGTFIGELEDDKFYESVPNKLFSIPSFQATRVKDSCLLIRKFGDALSCIICNGRVVFGNNYVRACQILNVPVHAYNLKASKYDLYNHYFSQKYGIYTYSHIERKDYVQGLAQMTTKLFGNSKIYKLALPFVTAKDDKAQKIFDFGCGKAFSINHMKKTLGYKHAIGLEFFNHDRKGISIEKGNKMINDVIAHVSKYGKFDVVICDSVLNSVNSQEAENNVLATLMLFCKVGGMVFFCGRCIEAVMSIDKQRRNTNDQQFTKNFVDENGLVGTLREGQWYYQKFHSKEDVDRIKDSLPLDIILSRYDKKMWHVGGVKTAELEEKSYLDAIDFEFNMVLPNNLRYNRHNDIRKLFGYPQKEEK